MFATRYLMIFLASMLMAISSANAKDSKNDYYRNFWQPKYHARALSYCSCDGESCGLPIANRYCQLMGYKKADKAIIAHNVGQTYFLDNEGECTGWECNGFKLIRCVSDISNKPPKSYDYRLKRVVYPRFNNYRIAWCYEDGKGCGEKTAYSYCRRLGYLKAKSYIKQENVPATKALGNQKLCFGSACSGFKEIVCYR